MSPITGYVSHCLGLTTLPDPATTAWVNAVIANGGSVSAGRQTIVDALIRGLKGDGVWSKLDRLWLHAAENPASSLTDVVATTLATAVNSPPFTTDRGYTGQDQFNPTQYIDSTINLSTLGGNYAQNSAHLSFWSVTNTASVNSGTEMGFSNGSTAGSNFLVTYLDGNVYGRINDASFSGSQGAPSTRMGHWLLNRSGASASQVYQNGSLFGSPNAASTTVFNANLYILCENVSAAPKSGSPNQVAAASCGGNLSSTDATNFYNRMRTYMTAVGVP